MPRCSAGKPRINSVACLLVSAVAGSIVRCRKANPSIGFSGTKSRHAGAASCERLLLS